MFLKFLLWHWMPIIIALGILAAHQSQALRLLLCLDPFGDHLKSQLQRQIDDRLHRRMTALRFRLLPQELKIQLQNIYRKFGQRVERGISASEIIHLNYKPGIPKPFHHRKKLLGVRYIS